MLRDSVRTTHAVSVNEIYETLQGEGLLVGTPSVFVRLQGCNLRCAWCDQPEALETPRKSVPVEDVVEEVKSFNLHHVVITGGEPFTQEGLLLLVQELLHSGFKVQIETNGTLWIRSFEEVAGLTHITCSPKAVARYFIHPQMLKYAKELKFVVDEVLTKDILLREEFIPFLESQHVTLQPESNRKEMFKKALYIQGMLLSKGYSVRVIPQTHKLVGLP